MIDNMDKKDKPSQKLAKFVSRLDYHDIPDEVVYRTQWLFLDWLGSAIAGSTSRTSRIFNSISEKMGPTSGPCTVFGSKHSTSALFAAMTNGASSHVVEQDDLHSTSILHPATVVFPPTLAVAQSDNATTGRDLIVASVAGYESGIRVGEYLGPSHYRIFHMTGTAGTIASAMSTSRAICLNDAQTLNALGSAGTQAAGLWQFLRDAADSKQLHTAKACSDGLLSAYTAQFGLTAASEILEGPQGISAGMHGSNNEQLIVDGLGDRWGLMETSFKYHASCRHTHPAADALLKIRSVHNLDYRSIKAIRAYVYQAAYDVLGAVVVPESIHQAKFSMGFVLALISKNGSASVTDFTDEALRDTTYAELREKVTMIVDDSIESIYPSKWGARVEVELDTGQILIEFVDSPKGDPDNMLTKDELEDKFFRLCDFAGLDAGKAQNFIDFTWDLPEIKSVKESFDLLV